MPSSKDILHLYLHTSRKASIAGLHKKKKKSCSFLVNQKLAGLKKKDLLSRVW